VHNHPFPDKLPNSSAQMDSLHVTSHIPSNTLSAFFDPKALAIIGSFKKGFFGGYVVVKSLLQGGYKGNIYPVNPKYTVSRDS